jgi:hypothetical protein
MEPIQDDRPTTSSTASPMQANATVGAVLRVVDLFCGEGATSAEGGWASAFRARGHEVFTVDFDPDYEPDLVADVLTMTPADLPWSPDVILASPPCQGFSIARMGTNWGAPHPKAMVSRYPHLNRPYPRTPKAEMGVALVSATLRLIRKSGATFWIMENPVGKLRKHPVVAGLERRTVTYCQYGREFMKPTDLWGGFPPSLTLRPRCHNNDPCHIASPRGSRTGTQGRPRLESTHVPYALSLAVCEAAERDFAAGRAYEPVGLL